jgi:hypothetical protein
MQTEVHRSALWPLQPITRHQPCLQDSKSFIHQPCCFDVPRPSPSDCDCGRALPRRPVGCRFFQAVAPSADRERGNRGKLDSRDGRPDSLRRGLGARFRFGELLTPTLVFDNAGENRILTLTPQS